MTASCVWRTASVDLVHARSVSMAIIDYPAILQELGRVLRPNGLFISCELDGYPTFQSALRVNPRELAPGAYTFFDVLTHALNVCRGIQPIAGTLPALLEAAGCFRDITADLYYLPIGLWHHDQRMKDIGRAFGATLVRYADSVKPLLLEAGLTEEQVATITAAYVHDLSTVPGLVVVLHTVHARRI
ncbi:hypothetical protein E4T56_gene16177 [Termitomyces sp. T112]|nr:hypothetical protein E4T56_gene16177 [Termitomyces sp. T112]